MEEQITALQKLINTAIEFCVNYSFQVIGAMITLVIGVVIANWVAGLFFKILEKKKMDVTLSKFLASIIKIIILAFAVIIALGKFGITIAPFIAALGAIAFGSTFAFQGPLSNYGAGLSIMMSRPFKVGETIQVAGVSGVVQDIKLASTTLLNEDGVQITIPNKHIVGEIVSNSGENRLAESVIGVSYDSDCEKAAQLIKQVLSQFKEIATTPAPQVGINQFGDSSINIGFRYWVATTKYFQVTGQVNFAVFKAFQNAGILIPFPQREVRILSEPSRT